MLQLHTVALITYVALFDSFPWVAIESCINVGAQKAKAPVVNATHVKPNDDNIKLLLQETSLTMFRMY